jgi:NADPH:quinone reductase-like Zn-dependent oxidoreductase
MKQTMKAVVLTAYGPPSVLQLREVDRPVPGSRGVLVRLRATSVNYGDLLARNFRSVTPRGFNMLFILWLFARLFFGVRRPRIKVLGSEFSGEVEAVGGQVKRFKSGDAVFGYQGQSMGAYAEYVCLPENGCLAAKPANMSFAEAAVVPYGAIMALNLLRRMKVGPGQKVLVIGASGGIGTAAVQIARAFGADVDGMCSAANLDYVRSLGASRALDYRNDDFVRNGESYDLVFDVLGRSSFTRCRGSLKANGRYLAASFKSGKLLRMLWTSLRPGKKAYCALAPGGVEDLLAVRELIEAGKIRAVIDRCFPLEEAAAAHRYAESGQARGKIALIVGSKEVRTDDKEEGQ